MLDKLVAFLKTSWNFGCDPFDNVGNILPKLPVIVSAFRIKPPKSITDFMPTLSSKFGYPVASPAILILYVPVLLYVWLYDQPALDHGVPWVMPEPSPQSI